MHIYAEIWAGRKSAPSPARASATEAGCGDQQPGPRLDKVHLFDAESGKALEL
jgi:hypothetical protein